MNILIHLKYITPMFKTLETLEEEEEEKRRMVGMDVPCNSFTCLVLWNIYQVSGAVWRRHSFCSEDAVW